MNLAFRLSYPILGLSVFARQLCLPVPAVLFLMTAGALARSGDLHMSLILFVGVGGCLAGDLVWFEAGRHWGSRIMRIICGFSSDPQYASQKAREAFRRWGLRSLFVAKFVPGLDGVTPPLAGLEGSNRIAFLAYDAVGSLAWAAAYAGIGFLFAKSLETIAMTLSRFGDLLAALIGIPLACYIVWRSWVMIRMLRRLRLRRMTPLLLHQKLSSGEKFAIIDLLSFDEERQDRPGLPGAFRIDPARLRARSKVISPKDLGIILYCYSSGELTSARVAVSLKKKGIINVWILEGGLAAWERAGLPVTSKLSSQEEVAKRYGIQILRHKTGRQG
jgi:membrane protein DedA with SNARE-associated domain/rhodanese-related sulfurtransferase